ncbi:hypothetical protein PR202_gb08186 [Eleusine coracana subsp. coracana]|uniref:GS catalytic domain-containing protein n=1 Tax=Eleusine coracana subsp. coracana TaxID=191504 RepID=A0AAV5ECE2_ELECO|nr:hypothetical protein PR202_gb08186 [Eleusine coracana subsp. coracana]
MLDLESHKELAPIVGKVLRIEWLAETIINDMDAEDALRKELSGQRPFRITNKNLIDYLFTCSLELAVSFNLPVQIHTGFGDKDLDLRKCNPLHLRAVLEDERFAKCQLVLLHASYPFSKEASYLASVYSQIYLDFGLAIPKLSVQGMTSSLKELLELAPINKVMFSTDGYAFPETYYLGAKRARDVVYRVLSAACEDGDLSIEEAMESVESIFRRNALHLYKLNVANGSINQATPIADDSICLSSVEQDVLFVRIVWNDASGQHRCRVVPAGRFYEITRNKGVGLTFASMGMTSFCDGPADGTNLTGVGEIRLVPDMSTLLRLPWSRREEMVMADMQIRPGEAWEYCPRNALRKVTKVLLDEFNVRMKAGFENEFYLRRKLVSDGHEQWIPYDNTNYCSTSAFDDATSILQEVYSSLKASDIVVEQVCAVPFSQSKLPAQVLISKNSFKNLILSSTPTLSRPDLNDIGSGSHVHLSLWENDQNVFMGSSEYNFYGMSKKGEQFLAGVYHHLPSILSFTAPHPNSSMMFTGSHPYNLKSFICCFRLTKGLKTKSNPAEYASKLKRLPQSLQEAVESISADKVLHELIGDKLVTAAIAIRKAEIDHYAKNPGAFDDLIHRY